MADVTLTAALRSNLLSLQGTQKLLDQTQLRLATGLKVNSALDNPNAFFAAQSLNNRSTDLARLLDGMGQAIQVLKATDEAIKSLTSLMEQTQAIAQQAKDSLAADPLANITGQATAFDDLRTQIDNLVEDAGYRGTQLLSSTTSQLVVTFNESGSSDITITGVDFHTGDSATPTGLGIDDTTTVNAWATTGDIDTSLAQIKGALDTIRAQAAVFGTNLNIIQTRQDFTQNLINILKEGADKLTVADKNEEGAKLLSLQTTQQLGITSLSLASQANQAILRLFQ
jgi:flagellin